MGDEPLASPTSIAAVEDFVGAVPALRDEWESHLDFHDEPLPYVFFGDVREWARMNLGAADGETRRSFAMALNRLSGSDDREVWNLVGVSFFEPLACGDQRSQDTLDALRPWLSSTSLELVAAFET